MTAIDFFGLLVPLSFLGLWLLEALFPARPWPARRGWGVAGLGFFVVMVLIGTFSPLLIPPEAFEWTLLDLSGLGPAGGFAVGWAVYTLAGFAWHRACHTFDPLWRWFHQMHHAPVRLDVPSGAVFHPLEMLAYTAITVGTTVWGLGLDPVAGAAIGWWAAFVSFFQHANLRTPRWLGWFVQRPEAHGLHHQPGQPAGNFSDLPLWDVLFGSFVNPERYEGEVGFPDGNDSRWLAMLAGRDANARPAASKEPLAAK
jgi:sterol desaturase/sphingolipid hydroxylase (fatty acid hydroxylase superfamily)